MASVDFNIAGLVFILDHTDAAALVNAGPNSDKISANICRGTATSAIWNVT
jgi:hypothetical protein